MNKKIVIFVSEKAKKLTREGRTVKAILELRVKNPYLSLTTLKNVVYTLCYTLFSKNRAKEVYRKGYDDVAFHKMIKDTLDSYSFVYI